MKFSDFLTYFTDTIFRRDVTEWRNPVVRWLVQQYRLLFYTARGLLEHGTIVRSAALTFYTLMSLVPILAVVFAVVKGFGLADGLIENLYGLFPRNPDIVDYIVNFAENALARTQGGVVAAVALVMLFWAVIRVFGSIESAFNNIWEVKVERSITRQWTDYIAVVMIVPILWIVANAVGNYAEQLLGFDDSWYFNLLSHLASMIVIWVMFTFLYIVIPNARVRFGSALMAGIVAGTIFLLFQWGYVYVQRWMTSYNAIYGSFAALPLLLIWMQTSWEILLFGGELSFAYQNIARFGEERESLLISYDQRRKVLLAVMLTVVRNFRDRGGALPADEYPRTPRPAHAHRQRRAVPARAGRAADRRAQRRRRAGNGLHSGARHRVDDRLRRAGGGRTVGADHFRPRADARTGAHRPRTGDAQRVGPPVAGQRAADRPAVIMNSELKKTVIIGSGNLAEALARAVAKSELELVQIFARNAERARIVAELAATGWETRPEMLRKDADIYLIAVSDRAVAEVAATLPIPEEAAVAHTAGSVPVTAIPERFARRAVFYPMQTFTRGREADFSVIPVFLEAPSPELRPELEAFARKLSGTVIWADSAQRCKVHLAAVFACNFANHMYAVGERIVRGAGLDFDVLKPLIAETAAKACDARSPLDVQTGPAVRNDFATKARHGDLLAFDLRLKNIYSTISQSIWETSKKI